MAVKEIEGIRCTLVFGHYKTNDDESRLSPDFSYCVELTDVFLDVTPRKIDNYKKELFYQLNQRFKQFEKEYKLSHGS